MKMTGNTILVTGGGSGIGRALAERFHDLGNRVIVAGRRRAQLDEVVGGRDGITAIELDVADPASVAAAAVELQSRFPELNILFNNAGVSLPEDLTADSWDIDVAEATIATNVMGVLRLTGTLLPLLRQRADATVITTTSALAFLPAAGLPTYSASKAFLHSWLQSLRHQLRNSGVEVIEVAPPYVQTELGGPQQASDPNAMPLDAFADEVIAILEAGDLPSGEVIVDRAKGYRDAERNGTYAETFAAGNPD